jgi:3-oxoacyl-[acyl-carrier protein] reductase
MANGLDGKVAIVTGASRGIGLAVAARLVQEGARVCVTARSPEPLAAAVEALGGGDHAIGVAGKAHDDTHRQHAVDATLAAYGRIDLLVNNAGINPMYGPLLQLEPAAAAKVVEVNVLALLAWTRAVHAAWFADHGGAVVNLSSVAGLRPAAGIAFYGGTKAMVASLTASLAAELAPTVRVNAVAPAVVKTKFATALFEGREEQVAASYPLGRLGVPDDVAGAVAFLLGDDASWITGQTLVIDGGLTLTGGL